MLKFKRRNMAYALGLATGLCACIGFVAPAGIQTVSAGYSDTQEVETVKFDNVAEKRAYYYMLEMYNVNGIDYDRVDIQSSVDMYDDNNNVTATAVMLERDGKTDCAVIIM